MPGITQRVTFEFLEGVTVGSELCWADIGEVEGIEDNYKVFACVVGKRDFSNLFRRQDCIGFECWSFLTRLQGEDCDY